MSMLWFCYFSPWDCIIQEAGIFMKKEKKKGLKYWEINYIFVIFVNIVLHCL